MANRIFDALLEEKIDIFRNAFKNVSKKVYWNEDEKRLTHPGEYGYYREIVCKEFIRFLIPRRLNIDHGFLMNAEGKVSTQCDIIVFDSNSTPLIENNERQRFYPAETVVAVGEVKSKLSKNQYIETINKLAEIKVLRDKVSSPSFVRRETAGEYDPVNYVYDNLFTFVICEKLDFDLSSLCAMTSGEYNPKFSHHHRHNVIFSIDDGILAYNFFDQDEKINKVLPYPVFAKQKLKNGYAVAKPDDNDHFKFLAQYLFMGTSSSSILFPDMAHYMMPIKGGELKLER